MVKKLTLQEFVRRANEVHCGNYDYSKVEYVNSKTKVCIICPKHGEFFQTPNKHINRQQGCPKCNGGVKYTKDDFIERAREIHGNKYDYSNVDYVNSKNKICIICEEHGEFWQLPLNHISKRLKEGCPKCRKSKLETEVELLLKENNIEFETQKTFDWLKYRNNQFLDFYLSKYNIAIECQGEQHFKPMRFNSYETADFKLIKKRDENKKILCELNNILILYYSNIPYGEVITSKELLLNEIKRHGRNKL